jgi:hypothetical protein
MYGGAMTFDQIALRLGCSKQAACQTYKRAIEKLRANGHALEMLNFYAYQLERARASRSEAI